MRCPRFMVPIFMIFLMMPMSAFATLIGTTASCDGNSLLRCALPGDTTGTATADPLANTVGDPSVEFNIVNINTDIFYDVDISSSSIMISMVRSGADLSGFGSLSFIDLSWGESNPGRITGFTLQTSGIATSIQPGTDGTSLTESDITFGDDFVTIAMNHTNWSSGSFARVDLQVTHGPLNDDGQGDETNAPIPEPSTMLLLGTGLAGVGFWRLKGRKFS